MGLVFAGGDSRRFGQNKALYLLQGQPMLAHVLARLAPQCDRTVIAGGRHAALYAGFGVPVLTDRPEEGIGPLGGLIAGLSELDAQDQLVTSPCDTPYLPMDFVARLAEVGPSYACADGRDHYAHALWQKDALPVLEEMVSRRELRIGNGLRALKAQSVLFEAAEAFRNFNTPPHP